MINRKEFTVKFKALLAILTSMGFTSTMALAGHSPGPPASVPEVSSNGALAAVVAVLAIGALIWERRRSSKNLTADPK
jgi:hypothetical protein